MEIQYIIKTRNIITYQLELLIDFPYQIIAINEKDNVVGYLPLYDYDKLYKTDEEVNERLKFLQEMYPEIPYEIYKCTIVRGEEL